MKKKCKQCGSVKSLDKFYVHLKNRDGHLHQCKECVKARVRARYASPVGRAKVREYERERNSRQDRKVAKLIYQKRRRSKGPGKFRANTMVDNAIRDGRLKREPCEKCGIQFVEAHHEDYRQPLKVRWLCFKHHREAHGQKVGP